MLYQFTNKKNYLKKTRFKKLKNYYLNILFYLKKLILKFNITHFDIISYIYFNNKKIIDKNNLIGYISKYNNLNNDIMLINHNYINDNNIIINNNSKLLIIKKIINFINLLNYFINNNLIFNIYYIVLNTIYYTFKRIQYIYNNLIIYYNQICSIIQLNINTYILNKIYLLNIIKLLFINHFKLLNIIKWAVSTKF